nr:fibronectin type III domain-containing protein [Rikenellaceae bacterium]
MMKKIFSLGLMLAALTLTNCSKDAVEEHVMPAGSADFEIFASTDEGRTANEGLKTVWKGGDQVNLFHSNSDGTYFSNGAFTIAEEDVATNRFTGKTAYELGADSLYNWYMIYPYKSFIKDPANEEDPENNIGGYFYIGSRSDSSQHQTEPDNMKHIAGTDVPLYGFVADVLGSEKPMLTMKHVTSVVEFNISNPTANDLTVTEIALTAPEAICGSFYPHFTADGQFSMTNHPTYTASTARLSITDGVVLAGESATFYMVVKPFALAADKELTIKVTADAGVCTKTITGKATTFTAGKIKTINFTYVAPVVEQKTWSLITSVDDLVDGKYVILAKDQAGTIGYLPAEATTTNPRFPSQEIFDTTTNTYSASVPEEMIWNFAQNAAGNWVITTNGGDYFYGINEAQGLKVGDTEDAWKITTHSKNAAAVTFRNDDIARNAGVYHKDGVGNSWRSYDGDTFSNYGTNGIGAQIILYYCGTIAEKEQLATPTVTATAEGKTITVSWTEVANAGSYEVTCGGETPVIVNDALTYTFADLDYETTYEISVVALPATPQTHKASEAGTASATTEPKPADALQTYTWTLATGELGTNGNGTTPLSSIKKGSPSLTWAAQYTWKSNTYLGWSSSYGVQIGSGSNPVTSVTLSTTFGSQIESITIGGATASSGNASVAVKVGDTTFTCNGANTAKMAINNSTAAYKFTTPTAVTGEIVITITNSASKAVYLREIQINK